jgi:hypothetical protein
MFLKDKTGAACKNKVSLILTGKAKKKNSIICLQQKLLLSYLLNYEIF